MSETVQIRVSGARALLVALCPERAGELREQLDDDATLAVVCSAVLRLAGTADVNAEERSSGQASPLAAFLGKRIHLNLTKGMRDGLAGAVPLLVKLAAGGGREALVEAAGVVAAVMVTNMSRVAATDWQVCVAVEALTRMASDATEDAILALLAESSPGAWTKSGVRERLDELTSKGIAELRPGEQYRLVF